MAHLKRYFMPRSWPLPVKGKTWVIRPLPGAHAKRSCMPLQVFIRDWLKIADTSKEAKSIIHSGKIRVDKRVRKESKFGIGLMDIVEIPDIKTHFRVIVNKRGLDLKKIDAKDADKKLCSIVNKVSLRKGFFQLNLHDGRNIKLNKTEAAKYKPYDSIVISLPDQNILAHNKLAKGSIAFIYAGKNAGTSGIIQEVKQRKSMLEKSTVVLKTDKKKIETVKSYVIPGDQLEIMKVTK